MYRVPHTSSAETISMATRTNIGGNDEEAEKGKVPL
jgi:hypothetical protein